MAVVFVLLLIRAEAGDVAPLGAFGEKGKEVVHEGEFGLGAGFPAECQKFRELHVVFLSAVPLSIWVS